MRAPQTRWHVLDDAPAVATEARRLILEAAGEALTARGRFHLVLAGGRTPEAAYRLLQPADSDFSRWHLWFGDERCRPPGDPARNSTLAEDALLGRLPVPPGQVHPIPAERGPEAGARAYAEAIRPALPFDLVLLGLGEDGHTASLFPGQPPPAEALVVPVRHAPKPPPERVSLGPAALERSRALVFLVTGAAKREAVAAWRRGDPIPAATLEPEGTATVLCDRAAGGED